MFAIVKRVYDRLVLWGLGSLIATLVAVNSFISKQRMSHENGLVAVGKLKVVENPQFPKNAFFQPGREFACRLRHTSIAFMDDAMLQVRSAALKLADADFKSPLDLEMNTGEFPPTPTAYLFWRFMVATIKGRHVEYKKYMDSYPRAQMSAQTGVRRNPTSFAQMYYYTQTVFHFKGEDGLTRYAKYRLIPQNRGEETGLHNEVDVWNQKRLPGDDRPRDYLRQEYKERLAQGPISYILQVQLHVPQPNDPENICSPDQRWDTETHPWLDVATVTVDHLIPYEKEQHMVYSIDQQPPSLGLIPAKSIHDYNSVNYLRVRSKPAKIARLWSYKVLGMPASDKRAGGGTKEALE